MFIVYTDILYTFIFICLKKKLFFTLFYFFSFFSKKKKAKYQNKKVIANYIFKQIIV